MTVEELLTKLDALQVELWSEDGRLRFRAPQGVMTERLKTQIRERKQELLSVLESTTAIPKTPAKSSFPLSHAQRRMWVLSQLDNAAAAYNIPLHQILTGPLCAQTLRKAISQVVSRHESLRTSIELIDGNPAQTVHSNVPVDLPVISLQGDSQPLEAARKIALDHSRVPFDLSSAPLFRATLLELSQDKHVLLFTIHHVICDGFSIGILAREVARCYEGIRSGQQSLSDPLTVQYRDYAQWHRQQLSEGAFAEDRRWWLESLSGELPVLNMPTDFPRPAAQTSNGHELGFQLNKELTANLRSLCGDHDTSLFVALLAILNVLLFKYTKQTDLIVGSPVAGRIHPDLADQIGLFLNTLALRTKIDSSESFVSLLHRTKKTVLSALDHQGYPFDELVGELDLRRDLSRNPLFDVTLILQNQDDSGLAFAGIEVTPFIEHPGTSKTDLTFNFKETPAGVTLAIEYNTDLFSDSRVQRIGGHFCQLAESVLYDPTTPISKLQILPDDEKSMLLQTFNFVQTLGEGSRAEAVSTRRELDKAIQGLPETETVVTMFERQCSRVPDVPAVVFGDLTLSYRELISQVDFLAQQLVAAGVGRGVLVGVFMDRGIDMLVATLAIMKAGGAYVPLDPTFPGSRLGLMIDDSALSLLIVHPQLVPKLPSHHLAAEQIVSFDEAMSSKLQGASDSASQANSSSTAFPSRVNQNDLAYVIYTSGSTGKPKGVCIQHGALLNFLHSMAQNPGIRQDDTLLAVTTLSFDISVLELYLPLTVGAKVVIASSDTAADGHQLANLIRQSGVTIMQATPATWQLLLAADWQQSPGLKALCGGEALATSLARELMQRCESLWNMYGPTETTIWSAIHQVTMPQVVEQDAPILSDTVVSIGTPIANTEMYILDEDLQPVPIGVDGDLYIGGRGLAAGYLNQPELTSQKFLPHPFSDDSDRRIYQTGDVARYREDGHIDFLGRSDEQEKLRGFRIELGDIQAALVLLPPIQQAVVKLVGEGNNTRLAAWCIAQDSQPPPIDVLREQLSSTLPKYMIPAQFLWVDEYPLTPNGKIDRKNLVATEIQTDANHAPPTSQAELKLARLWTELLSVQNPGRHDNFFDLGGHSLTATQLVSRIHSEMSIDIQLKDIFEHPTLAGLAQVAESRDAHNVHSIPKLPDAQHYPLSHGQRRLWVLSQFEEARSAYNLPAALLIDGPVDAKSIQSAIDQLAARHETLRTSFEPLDGEPVQCVAPTNQVKVDQLDLRQSDDAHREAIRFAEEDAARPFDLATPGQFRVSLLRLRDQQYVLLLNIHHIVCDQWSLDLLVREFNCCYHGSPLPPLPSLQYRDFAAWQSHYLASDLGKRDRDYWTDKLDGELPVINLPTDFPRPPKRSFEGGIHRHELCAKHGAALQRLSCEHQASLFAVVTSIVKTLLFRYTNQDDLIVGIPVSGRNHRDLEDQVGFFVNVLPLRSQVDGNSPFVSLLQQVSQSTRETLEHQAYPFDQLIDELNLPRDASRSPLVDVVVTLRHETEEQLSFGEAPMSNLMQDYHGSKYDLEFDFQLDKQQLSVTVRYSTDLFLPQTVQRITTQLDEIIRNVIESPNTAIRDLNLLSDAERQLVIHQWNQTKTDYPDACVHELFERAAARCPNAIALQFGDDRLTYQQLNSASNQVARQLRSAGVSGDDFVAVYIERSAQAVIGILGVLKAGGAYVPLDVDDPPARTAAVLDDVQPVVLLTRKELRDRITGDFEIILLDNVANKDSHQPQENLPSITGPDNLAYMIFTSGSTGAPKGVCVRHRGVVRLVQNTNYTNYGPDQTHLILARLAFDASTYEIWGPLLNGAQAVIAPPHTLSLDEIGDLLKQHQVTSLFITTGLFHMMVDHRISDLDSLKHLMVGGEVLSIEHAQRAQQLLRCRLTNIYGPTENVTFSTFYDIPQSPDSSVPIGKPISNSTAYVLDDRKQPVPIGVPGELYVGGEAVASHYHNRPELTQEKFHQDPFGNNSDRMYQTGDLVRWLPDGNIEFLGRKDTQVKIRGFRIELGEIESHLVALPSVRKAFVMTRTGAAGQTLLVAYIQPHSESHPKAHEIKQALSDRVPQYMVPSFVMMLERLPLNANKKVDREALPIPTELSSPANAAVPPRDDLESELALILGDLLNVDAVGIHDNFFTLGGDSLLATQAVARMRELFRADLSVVGLFTTQNVASMAEWIRDECPAGQADKIASAMSRIRNMSDEQKKELAKRRKALHADQQH